MKLRENLTWSREDAVRVRRQREEPSTLTISIRGRTYSKLILRSPARAATGTPLDFTLRLSASAFLCGALAGVTAAAWTTGAFIFLLHVPGGVTEILAVGGGLVCESPDGFDRWNNFLSPVTGGGLRWSRASTASIIAIVFAAADIVAGAGAAGDGLPFTLPLLRRTFESELLRWCRGAIGRLLPPLPGGLCDAAFECPDAPGRVLGFSETGVEPSTFTITHPDIAVSRRDEAGLFSLSFSADEAPFAGFPVRPLAGCCTVSPLLCPCT